MKEYPKINTIFKRTPDGRKVLWGEYSEPVFAYLANNTWVFTEKVDGTNIRVMWDGERVTFGGKTDAAQIPAKLFKRLQERFENVALFQTLFDGPACLYGEGYGAGIQTGGNYRPDQDFVLFDVKCGEWWLERADVEDVARKMGLACVPIIGEGTLDDLIKRVQTGFVSTWASTSAFMAEGIVARPSIELRLRNGERIITKLKRKDFRGVEAATREG